MSAFNPFNQEEIDMIRNNTLRFAIWLAAFVSAVGCGDASTDGSFSSKCEQMCQHGDSCPHLYAPSDCVSSCEAAVAESKLLGGTCPDALDAAIRCHLNLTCNELMTRATTSAYNDQCVRSERAVSQCIADGPEPARDELHRDREPSARTRDR